MMDQSSERQKRLRAWGPLLLLLTTLILLVAGLTVANYRFATANPGGNDFIPRWLGSRLLVERGQNPYGEETTLAIQEFMYGRPAAPNEDQALFVYPLYSVVLFAPFALVDDYVLARAIWMTTLELALLGLALVSVRLVNWRPRLPILAMTMLFALVWYHSVRPLINGNAAILVALFVASGLYLLKLNHDLAAGALLAAATIKPQAMILLLPLLLIWALSQRRFRFILGTSACLVALFLLATIVEPSWLWQNLEQVMAYPNYTLAGTPGAIFELWFPEVGRWVGAVLTVLLGMLVLWQWRIAWGSRFQVLLPVAYFTLAATNLIGITTAASNYIALFPGLILLFAYWQQEDRPFRDGRAVAVMLLLLIGLWYLFWISRSGRAQSPVMFFPLPLLLLLFLPFVARSAARFGRVR